MEEKVLLADDAPQEVKTTLAEYGIAAYLGMAQVFAADRPQLPSAKVWEWDNPLPCNLPRAENVKARQRKNRRKKRARKNKRGY